MITGEKFPCSQGLSDEKAIDCGTGKALPASAIRKPAARQWSERHSFE